MSAVVKSLVAKPLSLFVTTTCPFCQQARRLAASKGVNAEVLELNTKTDGPEIRRELTELTKQTTIPYVFSSGRFIGGFSELSKEPESFWSDLQKK